MRLFFSVGEPSGDLHGSNLIRSLKQRADIECVGFGGPKMREAGCELHYELTQMAVMFLAAVIKNLRFFFKLIGQADHYFANHHVDAVVLIDYPGFNWWIARKAKKHGIPVFYYGVPQVWAWAPWRVRKIRRLVDHVLCKLPFEVDWFRQRNCHATYVGHPYFDQIARQTYDEAFLELMTQSEPGQLPTRVTLLPGSRNSEVESVMPILISVAEKVRHQIPDCRIAVASYNQHQASLAAPLVASVSGVEIHVGKTPELMRLADVCVACSGSVSLELLHHRKPTIIVFKIKRWAMWLQALLLKTRYITLVNLIASKDIRKRSWSVYNPEEPGTEQAVMPEYLTTGDPSEAIAARVIRWLQDPAARQATIDRLDQLANQYAIPGATERAADYLLHVLADTMSIPESAAPQGRPFPVARKSA